MHERQRKYAARSVGAIGNPFGGVSVWQSRGVREELCDGDFPLVRGTSWLSFRYASIAALIFSRFLVQAAASFRSVEGL